MIQDALNTDSQKDQKKKTWIYIGVGCAGLLLICVIVGLGVGWWLFADGFKDPEQVNIQIFAPDRIQVGESDEILIDIQNLASESQIIDSVDFDLTYIEGIAITDVNPSYELRERYEVFGFESYFFSMPLSSQQSVQLSFTIEGLNLGQYVGLISVCINESSICSDYDHSIIVIK